MFVTVLCWWRCAKTPTKAKKGGDTELSDEFSSADKRIHMQRANIFGNYTSYLGTPSGTFKALNPSGIEYIL